MDEVLSHPPYYVWREQIILQDHPGGLSVARGTTYMAVMVSPGDTQWQPHLVWGIDFSGTIIEMTSPKETHQKIQCMPNMTLHFSYYFEVVEVQH